MTINPARVSDLLHFLRYHHDGLDFSYRALHDVYFPKVPGGTLGRIAKSNGAYIPRKHWKALGLIQRRARTDMEKQIATMAAETRKALKVMR